MAKGADRRRECRGYRHLAPADYETWVALAEEAGAENMARVYVKEVVSIDLLSNVHRTITT